SWASPELSGIWHATPCPARKVRASPCHPPGALPPAPTKGQAFGIQRVGYGEEAAAGTNTLPDSPLPVAGNWVSRGYALGGGPRSGGPWWGSGQRPALPCPPWLR